MKILIIILLIYLLGCRSTKSTTRVREEMKRNAEMSTVGLKAAQKEINTVTYWPDGSVYSFEQLQERVEGVELAQLNVKEKQVQKNDEVIKQQESLDFWLYGGIALTIVVLFWVYKMRK